MRRTLFLLRSVLLTSAIAVGAFVRDAHAAGPAYTLEPEVDAPILLIGGSVTTAFFLMGETPGVTCAPECDRANVNVLDRWAAGNYDAGWVMVGNIGAAATILFGPLVLTLRQGARDGLHDSVVVGEAVILTSALQVLTSYAIERPRPRAYAGDDVPIEDRTDADTARSFFSGHTATSVASVVATTRTLQKLGHRQLAGLVLGFGIAGSSLVGTSRVLSGGHFPTDVVAGAAVGTAFGLLVPHLRSLPVTLAPTAGGAALAGTF